MIRWRIEALSRERERRGAFHYGYNDIISLENLFASWKEFLRGKRKRKDIARFALHLTDNIISLHRELAEKIYQHGPYRAFKINDPKPRDIHKASVRDRLVHHALCRILGPYFEGKFIFDSYSCRVDKGTHRAMNHLRDFARKVSRNHTRTVWALKCDIRKFFANIDHVILKKILEKYIADVDALWLLRQIVDSFHTKEKPGVGLPLGNLTSQLLVNIYMNEFDQFTKRDLKMRHYVRYADDFVVVHERRNDLKNIVPKIVTFLKTKLKLELHPGKLSIAALASGVDFLGWVHFPHCRVLRTATKKRMFKRLNASHKKEEAAISYHGLLSHGDAHKLTKRIELVMV